MRGPRRDHAIGGAPAIEGARDGAGVLAKLVGFAFEPVDFLDDFDRDQDVVVLKTDEGVGVVQEDVGINRN